MKPDQPTEEAEHNLQYEAWLVAEFDRDKRPDDQDWFGD